MATSSGLQGSQPVDWVAVTEEFKTRGVSRLRQAVARLADPDIDALATLFEGRRAGDEWDRRATTLIRRAFEAAARTRALPLTAAYLYVLCQVRWELIVDNRILRAGVIAADELAALPGELGDDRVIAGHLVDMTVSLAHCFASENALNCSCPVDMRRHAALAAEVGARIEAAHTAGADDGPARFVRYVARNQRVFTGALTVIAEAVEAFVCSRHVSKPILDGAIASTLAAERDEAISGDVYESELRSHRTTLQAMVDVVSTPQLQVDDGRIFYIYPFAVLGMAPDDIRRVLSELPRGSTLGGATVVDTAAIEVSDAWGPADADGRDLGGVTVHLADLSVTTTAGPTLEPHDVEVRATNLGACYVRIATRLAGASEHELNQAMRRGSPHMGVEHIREDGRRWDGLSQYAGAVIEATAALLRDGEPGARIVATHPNRYHTVLSIREMSTADGTGDPVPALRYDQVDDTLGARLFGQRIGQASAIFEEYVRVDSRDPSIALADVGFDGEVIVRNTDSTIVVMPTSPNFNVLVFEEMAEFTASLPALLDKWGTAISTQSRELAKQLPALDDVVWGEQGLLERDGAKVSRALRSVERRQSELQRTVAEAQSIMAFVRSAGLCRTARYRRNLDLLFEEAGVTRAERDLEAQIARVEALYQHVHALARRLEEREQRRYRRAVEIILAVLAVASLADFFALFNSMMDPSDMTRVVGGETAFVLVVSIVVVLTVIRMYRSGSNE